MAHARIQKLTNLVSNESLKPHGYRFDKMFFKFLISMGDISKDGEVKFLRILSSVLP